MALPQWQQFRRIIVPLLRPASVVVISLAVINTLKGFDIVFMLTRGGPFHTSEQPSDVHSTETSASTSSGYGAAIATCAVRSGHRRHRGLLPPGPGLGALYGCASAADH